VVAQRNATNHRTRALVGARSSTSRTGAPEYLSSSPTVVAQGDIHLTHQPRSSLGAPIRRGLMIEFTSTLFNPTGDQKSTRNLMGAGASATFHPWVWLWAGFCQARPVAIPSRGFSFGQGPHPRTPVGNCLRGAPPSRHG
jgi:hypothetical protein